MFQPKHKKTKHQQEVAEIEELNEAPSTILREALSFLWEICKVVLISLAIIIPIRYFLIQPFYVKGASMEPNFHDHEYLIVDQISYRFGDPERGDVVVFRYPRDPKEYFIKRVIGLPGETVIVKNKKIFVYNKEHPDGVMLDEKYLPENIDNVGSVTEKIEESEYFLMGDNRPESLDSRVFGPVKKKNIIGKVFFRGWPLNKIKLFLNEEEYTL